MFIKRQAVDQPFRTTIVETCLQNRINGNLKYIIKIKCTKYWKYMIEQVKTPVR